MSTTSSHSQSLSRTSSEPAIAQLIPQSPQPLLRTLSSVRSQVAQEITIKAVTKSNIYDNTRIGIIDTSTAISTATDQEFFHLISTSIRSLLSLQRYLFFITSTATSPEPESPGLFLITSSSSSLTSRAVLLTNAKFTGRIINSSYIAISNDELPSDEKHWISFIKDFNITTNDQLLLTDILTKSSRIPLNPTLPPPGSKSINTILDEARAKLQRISSKQALNELQTEPTGAPTFLVDIRPEKQREVEGWIKGALVIERNVLEWRFDPRCEARLEIADRYDLRIIVFCSEGYTSR